MKIPSRTIDMHVKGHVVGCGVQGPNCLALDLSQAKNGKWSINWSLAGELGEGMFAASLSKLVGKSHFWVSPCEEGGLQVETSQVIEIPDAALAKKGLREDFFTTQIKSRFVNETVVIGGMRMQGPEEKKPMQDGGKHDGSIHNVGGGAIRDNVKRDYRNWYSKMHIRRPHVASTALALANSYLALYPAELRASNPLRLVVLKGRSVYRAILMDDWKYIDEVVLPRMEGDDASIVVIEGRIQGWVDFFSQQHPAIVGERKIVPLLISVKENHISDYEHWDLWGEAAMDKIDMGESTAHAILMNRDIAPIAFGMALQGGC